MPAQFNDIQKVQELSECYCLWPDASAYENFPKWKNRRTESPEHSNYEKKQMCWYFSNVNYKNIIYYTIAKATSCITNTDMQGI